MRYACLLVYLSLVAAGPIDQTQGRLVIVTEGTKQYHRPSCPIVRDGKQKDIVAMNAGQAELRGYKPHPDCDSANPANQTAPDAEPTVEQRQRGIFVYTAADDSRYHRETCARLPKEHRKIALEEAGKKLWPCPVCRPPVRKRTPAIPKR